MKKEIIILGDIEMGGGTLTDDFVSDKALSALLTSFTGKPHPVDLILNGDTIDFLKCPYIHKTEKSYPRHITAKISLAKLKLVHQAHQPVFDSLATFLRSGKNRVFFIIGNHDADMVFPEVQRKIKAYLGNATKVHFRWSYAEHGIYVEHGQQYDFLNKVNRKYLFLNYRGEKILNIPWVAFGLISRFMTLKEKHPFLERIKPLPVLFSHHRAVVKHISWRTLEYFGKSIIYYPIRYWKDPTYIFPRWLFREFYRRFTNNHWDVDKVVDVFKRKKRNSLANHQLYVLGHIHELYQEKKEGWAIVHPDTWRDEYIIDEKTGILTAKQKQYVHVRILDDETLQWDVRVWSIPRKKISCDEVINDEMRFLHHVAQEEGYTISIPVTTSRRTARFK